MVTWPFRLALAAERHSIEIDDSELVMYISQFYGVYQKLTYRFSRFFGAIFEKTGFSAIFRGCISRCGTFSGKYSTTGVDSKGVKIICKVLRVIYTPQGGGEGGYPASCQRSVVSKGPWLWLVVML